MYWTESCDYSYLCRHLIERRALAGLPASSVMIPAAESSTPPP